MTTRTLAALLAGGLVAAGGVVLLSDDDNDPIDLEPTPIDAKAERKAAWDERVATLKAAATKETAATIIAADETKDAQHWAMCSKPLDHGVCKADLWCCRKGVIGCAPTASGNNGKPCIYEQTTGPWPERVGYGEDPKGMARSVWEDEE